VDVGRGDEVEFVPELSAVEYAGFHEEAVEDEPEVRQAGGEEEGECEEVGGLGWRVMGNEMIVAGGWAVDFEVEVEEVAGGREGLGQGVVGVGGPGLIAGAVFDGAFRVGLGFHEGVEGAQFPFGAEAGAGEEEAVAARAIAPAGTARDEGEGAGHSWIVCGMRRREPDGKPKHAGTELAR
jgi:hypothetical protein